MGGGGSGKWRNTEIIVSDAEIGDHLVLLEHRIDQRAYIAGEVVVIEIEALHFGCLLGGLEDDDDSLIQQIVRSHR